MLGRPCFPRTSHARPRVIGDQTTESSSRGIDWYIIIDASCSRALVRRSRAFEAYDLTDDRNVRSSHRLPCSHQQPTTRQYRLPCVVCCVLANDRARRPRASQKTTISYLVINIAYLTCSATQDGARQRTRRLRALDPRRRILVVSNTANTNNHNYYYYTDDYDITFFG